MHAFFPEEIPEQARVFEIRSMFDHRVSAEMRKADRDFDFFEILVERAAEPADALFHLDLQTRPFALQMLDHAPRRGERQRVANERSGEERDADFREAVVAIIPRPAVERVHVFVSCRQARRWACRRR